MKHKRPTDTERLDWIQKNVADVTPWKYAPRFRLTWEVANSDDGWHGVGRTLRAAIDAAMRDDAEKSGRRRK